MPARPRTQVSDQGPDQRWHDCSAPKPVTSGAPGAGKVPLGPGTEEQRSSRLAMVDQTSTLYW